MIAARVWRIIWATTTNVRVRQGRTMASSFSHKLIWLLILEILGNITTCTDSKAIRIYATKNSGKEIVLRVTMEMILSNRLFR